MSARGPDRVGEIIGNRYRLISPLGEGGFGVAYRAWDNQAGVPVVIKMPLAKHLARPVVIERFEREVIRLRECGHPHIVPIIDDGLDGDGRPYLVMRFLPGGSLADRRKPAGPTSLHRWLPAIASALDYTHSLGVLHRDVKPSNIFFDTQARAYLGDFGIAKLAEDQEDGGQSPHGSAFIGQNAEESLTRTGGLIGTAVYMAPEAFNERLQPSRQSDQYSLAVSVYEMLSGKFPYLAKADELRVLHETRQPSPLEARIKGLPPSLYAAVRRGLSKQPDARFAACRSFAEAVLADVPFTPVDPSHHRFLCPACDRLVRVPDDFGGRACRCPDCRARLKVSRNIDALWTEEEAGALEPRKYDTLDRLIANVLAEEQQATRNDSQKFSESNPRLTDRGGRLSKEGDEGAAEAEPLRKTGAPPAKNLPAGGKTRVATADQAVVKGALALGPDPTQWESWSAISQEERARLLQCYQAGMEADGSVQYAMDMFAQCLLGDPGNPVFLQAFLVCVRQRYGLKKSGIFTSVISAGGRRGLKRLAAVAEWRELIKQGVEILKNNLGDQACLLAMAEACENLMYVECQGLYLRAALDVAPADVDVNRQCARYAASLGHYDQAVECWRRIARVKGVAKEAEREIAKLSDDKKLAERLGLTDR